MALHSLRTGVAVAVLALVSIGCATKEEPPCPAGFTLVPWGAEGDPTCDGCPDGSPAPTCVPQAGQCEGDEGTGEALTYVVTLLELSQADLEGDPDAVDGFDLDGRVSDRGDFYGCLQEDYVSPAPEAREGVDNQIGPLWASVSSSVGWDVAEHITSGSLLVLLTLEGVDSLSEDPCVRVTLERGTLDGTGGSSPVLDASGRLAPGQAFRVQGAPWVDGRPAEITGGRLELGPLPVTLPLDLGSVPFPLEQARLRLEPSADGFEAGLLGGAVDPEDAAALLVSRAPEIPMGIARNVMEGQADLHPDDEGSCRAVSVAFDVEGVRAVRE